MKLGEIAEKLGGQLTGGHDVEIRGVAGIEAAGEGDITYFADRRLAEAALRCRASAIVVQKPLEGLGTPQVVVANPQYAFALLLEIFHKKPALPGGISDRAYVSPQASVGKDVTIHAFVSVCDGASVGDGVVLYPGVYVGEGATIGAGCVIYPNVTLREGITVGSRVIIHAGAVIGADGFRYVFEAGRHYKVPQVGGVIIGDDAEIGANVTIDRGTTENTVIGAGTKIDNLVQIAHNVTVGNHAIIVSQVGIAGSSRIGNYAMLGGQVGVSDHVTIEDGTMIAAQAGVMSDLAKGVYSGSPAMPHREFLRCWAVVTKLPELNRRIRELEGKLKALEDKT